MDDLTVMMQVIERMSQLPEQTHGFGGTQSLPVRRPHLAQIPLQIPAVEPGLDRDNLLTQLMKL